MKKITQEQWEKLSNEMVEITRHFNMESDWQTWTTSAWRGMADQALLDLLEIIDIKTEK